MRQVSGDLWGFAEYGFADVVVITTNGSINKAGLAVMGRGCAKQAAQRFPILPRRLAQYIEAWGNRPFILQRNCPPSGFTLVTMPVKHELFVSAVIDLICQSAQLLAGMAERHHWQSVVLPRAGCGNGHLSWADVGPTLEGLLDDTFTAVTFG